MNEKTGVRGGEPTGAELELIYTFLARGSGDSEVLTALSERGFPQRSPAFIQRRRRELAAARKVLEARLRAEMDPEQREARSQHIRDMTSIAEIMIHGLDGVQFHGENNYELSRGVSLTRKQLIEQLISNLRRAREECRGYNRYQNFIIHFSARVPDNEGIETYAERHPIALVNLLRSIVLKKDFGTGVCPVCKNW